MFLLTAKQIKRLKYIQLHFTLTEKKSDSEPKLSDSGNHGWRNEGQPWPRFLEDWKRLNLTFFGHKKPRQDQFLNIFFSPADPVTSRLTDKKNNRIKELEPRVKSAAEAINSLKVNCIYLSTSLFPPFPSLQSPWCHVISPQVMTNSYLIAANLALWPSSSHQIPSISWGHVRTELPSSIPGLQVIPLSAVLYSLEIKISVIPFSSLSSKPLSCFRNGFFSGYTSPEFAHSTGPNIHWWPGI